MSFSLFLEKGDIIIGLCADVSDPIEGKLVCKVCVGAQLLGTVAVARGKQGGIGSKAVVL